MGILATNGSTWYPQTLDTTNTIGDWIETGDNFGISIQLLGTWTGTVSFEQTNEPTLDAASYALLLMNAVTTTTTATSATANGLWQGPCYAKYFRIRFSTATSGSPQAVIKLTQCSDQMASSFQVTLGGGSQTIGNVNASTGLIDTTTALGSSATFTGTARIMGNNTMYSWYTVTAFADVAGTLYIEWSLDNGATWQTFSSIAVAAGTTQQLSCRPPATVTNSLLRAKYVNGALTQSTFRLATQISAN